MSARTVKAVAVTSAALLLPAAAIGWAAWFLSAAVSIVLFARPLAFTYGIAGAAALAAFAIFFRWLYPKFRKRVVAEAEIKSLEASLR